IVYLPGEPVHVYFEVRQLADGRLLIACVSMKEPIRENPVHIAGYLMSGEPFDTMWGRGIREIHRSEGNISKAHYIASMTPVRYTSDLQPDDWSAKFALHNFIPGSYSPTTGDGWDFKPAGYNLTISPVGNYNQQADQLLSYGGNLRTAWVTAQLADFRDSLQI